MLALFSQNPPPPNADAAAAGIVMVVLGMYGLFFIVAIATFVAMIFLYVRMSNALSECRPRNRQMEPGYVWLNLIPLFGIVWLILSIIRTSDSLTDELESRGMKVEDNCGKTTGLIFYVTTLIGCLPINLIFLFMYASKLGQEIERVQRHKCRDREGRDDRDLRRRNRNDRDDDDYDDDD
jgi:heme/copper-type cytochrome/quinol oxidase subunit 2